jgi:hypothetical protein
LRTEAKSTSSAELLSASAWVREEDDKSAMNKSTIDFDMALNTLTKTHVDPGFNTGHSVARDVFAC